MPVTSSVLETPVVMPMADGLVAEETGVSEALPGIESERSQAGSCVRSCEPCDPRHNDHCGNHGNRVP